MYRAKITNNKKEMKDPPPFGPAAPPGIVAMASYMEVWCSGFLDPGPDYTEFRIFGGNGVLIWKGRVDGY